MAKLQASSKTMLREMLQKREQSAAVRLACATALHAQDPEGLEPYAREAALDAGEDPAIRAVSLSVLTMRPKEKGRAEDPGFDAALEKACKGSASKHLARAYQRYRRSRGKAR